MAPFSGRATPAGTSAGVTGHRYPVTPDGSLLPFSARATLAQAVAAVIIVHVLQR